MVPWRFILADPVDGTEVAELFEARGREITPDPLNGLPTVSMTLDLDNPVVDTILGATAGDRINLLLKAYRGAGVTDPVFVGPLTAAEEVGTEQGGGTFSLAAAGALWRLQGRMVGKTTAGYGDGTPLAMKDLGEIAENMVIVVNAEAATGIVVGTVEASSDSYVGPFYFKKVAEAIAEIGPGVLGGFDYRVAPLEPYVDAFGDLIIGELAIYASRGVHRANAVFEHGTGRRNVREYRRPIDGAGVATKAFALPPGFPDGVDVAHHIVSVDNPTAIAARGLVEDVVGGGDIGPDELRTRLADEHVRIRKQPRETFYFTPTPSSPPEWGLDYEVGDTVPARAVRNGRTRIDAVVRVYGVKFSLDDHGLESAELTLIAE